MSTLLSTSEIANLTGLFQRNFDTFSYNRTRTITVYKESQEVVPITGVNYPGYQHSSNLGNIVSYTSRSSSFPAVISYLREHKISQLTETKANIPKDAEIKIIVEKDCSDYINTGKTTKIIVDNSTCLVVSPEVISSFLGLRHYVYYLEITN
jgi:hypothetical protein